jgi:two-component system, response regulator YesN
MFRLLIVDDEKYTRTTIRRIIRFSENRIMDIHEAIDGIDAYYKICQVIPDIMILDMDMPRLDGASLLERLKADNIHIKTIVVSAHDNFKYMKKSLKYGVVDYLLKPVNREALNNALTNVVLLLNKDKVTNNRNYEQSFLQDWIVKNQKFFKNTENNIIVIIFSELLNSEMLKTISDVIHINFIGMNNLIYCFSCNNVNKFQQINNSLNEKISVNFTGFSYQLNYLDRNPTQIYGEIRKTVRSMNIVDFDNIIHMDFKAIEISNVILDFKNMNYYNTDAVIKGIDFLIGGILESTINTPKNISINFLRYTETIKMWCDIKDIDCNFIYDWIMNIEESINSYNINIIMIQLEEIKNSIRQYIVDKNSNLSSNIRDFIENNYKTALTLNALEGRFNYSKEHMLREFKKEYGMSIISYLNKVRIEKAIELITKGFAVGEACYNVGFSDLNYFRRKFKDIKGMSPGAYLKFDEGIKDEK